MNTQYVLEYLAAHSGCTKQELLIALGEDAKGLLDELTAQRKISECGDGYCLNEEEDILTGYELLRFSAKYRKLLAPQVYPLITSTNTVLLEEATNGAPEGRWLLAGAQSAGVGRMGRKFFSPEETGLYMSLLLRPKDTADIALRLTTAAAAAVCDALIEEGLPAQIKWVNDIYIHGRKVCGILAQAQWEKDYSRITSVVVGIGINVYEPNKGFPEEIRDIAGALGLPRQKNLRNRIAARIVEKLWDSYQDLQHPL